MIYDGTRPRLAGWRSWMPAKHRIFSMRTLLAIPVLLSGYLFVSLVVAGDPYPHGPPSWAPWAATHSLNSPKASATGASGSCGYAGGAPTATIDAGVVIGTQTSLPTAIAPVNKFLGVPFAQSPPERFSPPQKPARFSAPINATAYSPACIQSFSYPVLVQEFTEYVFNNPGGPPPVESEDCLYLNVFAPSSPAPADGRAVLFWIFGGALQFGDAGQPGYDGSFLAAYEDVIVVTTNYRTNLFGFAPSPELPLTERNLGFLDQRLALDWVQRNIAAFGGSPDKLTIFGESAGGFSVDALLTSYNASSTPPFRAGIIQSGAYKYSSPAPGTAANWYNISATLGCPGTYSSNLTCLRAVNATLIKNAVEQSEISFQPVFDNFTYHSDILQRRLDGNVAHVPTLAGSNAQEGRVFEVSQTNVTSGLQAIFGNLPDLISTLEKAYADVGSGYDQLSQVYTEVAFQCTQAVWSNATAASGLPTWRYYYNASFANVQRYPGLGVYHSSEIPLVFGTYPKENATTQEVALATSMMNAWARFAKNPAGGPGWNPVGTGAASNVLVGATDYLPGGVYTDVGGAVQGGAFDLGLLGNRGNAQSSGVTVIDQSEVDFRCSIFTPLYAALNGVTLPS